MSAPSSLEEPSKTTERMDNSDGISLNKRLGTLLQIGDVVKPQEMEGRRMFIFVPVLSIDGQTSSRTAQILFELFQHLYMSDGRLTSEYLSTVKRSADQMVVIETVASEVIDLERGYEASCAEDGTVPEEPRMVFKRYLPRVLDAVKLHVVMEEEARRREEAHLLAFNQSNMRPRTHFSRAQDLARMAMHNFAYTRR